MHELYMIHVVILASLRLSLYASLFSLYTSLFGRLDFKTKLIQYCINATNYISTTVHFFVTIIKIVLFPNFITTRR
jgi:hypothetical protein